MYWMGLQLVKTQTGAVHQNDAEVCTQRLSGKDEVCTTTFSIMLNMDSRPYLHVLVTHISSGVRLVPAAMQGGRQSK